jgi:hypothetical protein
MARIFPNSISHYDFKEQTEEKIFNLLKNFPDDCRVWYEVVLGVRGRKPDFMIMDPKRGVIVIEVKGWGESTIVGASPTEFKIMTTGGDTVKVKNPTRKCKVYLEEATEKLELNPKLIGKFDKLIFPVDYFLVFPNLTEKSFDDLGLNKEILGMDKTHIVFRHEASNQSAFQARILSLLPELRKPLDIEMQLSIRNSLQVENTIDAPGGGVGLLPGIAPAGKIEIGQNLSNDLFAIDIEQEELAKEIGTGPRLMRGIAGTGKTLIMLMRAKLVASNSEQLHRKCKILVLCWNASLANYMRQAFDNINIPLTGSAHTMYSNASGVPIMHFMEFARQLVNNHPEARWFPRSSEKDFEIQATECIKKTIIREDEKYDLIIVDEGQDFLDEWLRFLFEKMLKGTNPLEKNLIVAADDAQRVYKSRNFTWKNLGIPMMGERSKILRKIYRNSARVWGFAGLFMGDIKKYYDENPELSFTPKRGVDPKLIDCAELSDQIDECIKEIKSISSVGYSWRNVNILYHSKYYRGYPVVEKLIERLNKEKIPFEWISENMDAKTTFDWGADCVKISTATSAKGLDAPKAIILNAEAYDDNDEYDDSKLMYVAMTRAREELVILHSGQKGIVPQLQKCASLYKKFRPKLIELEKKAKENSI